jgi:hypothetical protein
MSTPTISQSATVALRAGISGSVAVSGWIHAALYMHGCHYVPTIGPAFLLLHASVFVALVILIATAAR